MSSFLKHKRKAIRLKTKLITLNQKRNRMDQILISEEDWEEDDLVMRSDRSNEESPCESPTSKFMPKVIYLDGIEKGLLLVWSKSTFIFQKYVNKDRLPEEFEELLQNTTKSL